MPGCIAAFEQLIGHDLMQRELGLGGRPTELTSWLELSQSLVARYERGEIKSADFIDKICALAHTDIQPLAVIHAWNTMHAGIPIERINYLQQLRKEGCTLYLLSNNNDIHWQHTNAEYPQLTALFNRCFLSHELHCAKPYKDIYLLADREIKALNTNADSIIFIDDLAVNRLAAELYTGWQTCAGIDELQALLAVNCSL